MIDGRAAAARSLVAQHVCFETVGLPQRQRRLESTAGARREGKRQNHRTSESRVLWRSGRVVKSVRPSALGLSIACGGLKASNFSGDRQSCRALAISARRRVGSSLTRVSSLSKSPELIFAARRGEVTQGVAARNRRKSSMADGASPAPAPAPAPIFASAAATLV